MRQFLILFTLVACPVTAEQDLRNVDAVFYGEVHDNPAHHVNQAQWVAQLMPTAIVFEMLNPEEAALVMSERQAGRFESLADSLNWANSGWPDWAMYAQILKAAPNAAVIGAEVPRARARRAFSDGAAAAFGDQAGAYGLDTALPEAQQTEREEMQFAAHCEAVPRDILPGFVQAQRLRDARLAQAVAEALDNYGPPVAVITGNGHARDDWGAPAVLALARPDISVMTIGQFEEMAGADQPYDRIVVTPAAERDDPCASFQ